MSMLRSIAHQLSKENFGNANLILVIIMSGGERVARSGSS